MTGHHLEFLSLKGGYTGLPESIIVNIPHCWKSCAVAHLLLHSFPTCFQTLLNNQVLQASPFQQVLSISWHHVMSLPFVVVFYES